MALPRAMRFAGSAEVRAHLGAGRRLWTPLGRAVLNVRGRGRALFVVPSTVSKRSTVRNRIRRQLDGWAAGLAARSLKGLDLVVFVSPDARALSAAELRQRAGAMLGVVLSAARRTA